MTVDSHFPKPDENAFVNLEEDPAGLNACHSAERAHWSHNAWHKGAMTVT